MRKFGFFQNSRSTLLSWQKGLSTLARDAITEADSPVLLNPNYPPNGGDTVTYDSTDRTWKPLPVADKDGWIPVYETWTYSSTGTYPGALVGTTPWYIVNVQPDATTRFQTGFKVRLKQGGAYLYFYIIYISVTPLSQIYLFGDNGTVLANAAITDIAYSIADRPRGFPTMMYYIPHVLGYAVGGVTNRQGYFYITGGLNYVTLFISGTGAGTGAVDIRVTAPIDCNSTASGCGILTNVTDNAPLGTQTGCMWISTGAATIYLYPNNQIIPTPWSGGGGIMQGNGTITYPYK